MYDPDDLFGSSCDKCPKCGKFVSLEDGYYDREDREDEGSYMLTFCDEHCADSWQEVELLTK